MAGAPPSTSICAASNLSLIHIFNTVRSEDEAVWVTRWVMLAGWGAAAIAVLFYVLQQAVTVAILDRLARFD